MTYEIKFEVEGLPHTTNNSGRKHWAIKANEARKWKSLVWESIIFGGHRKPQAPLKKATLTLTRFSSVCPDADGIASSFKHVIDGLINAKIIENDKMENIGFPNYRWEKVKRGEGKIRIEVAGEE